MAIEKICSHEILNRGGMSSFSRDPNANFVKVEFGKLIQYGSNSSRKEPLMFDISRRTVKFNCTAKKFGALISYMVQEEEEEGNTLNSFHYLA